MFLRVFSELTSDGKAVAPWRGDGRTSPNAPLSPGRSTRQDATYLPTDQVRDSASQTQVKCVRRAIKPK